MLTRRELLRQTAQLGAVIALTSQTSKGQTGDSQGVVVNVAYNCVDGYLVFARNVQPSPVSRVGGVRPSERSGLSRLSFPSAASGLSHGPK